MPNTQTPYSKKGAKVNCTTESLQDLTNFELADRLVYAWCDNDRLLKEISVEATTIEKISIRDEMIRNEELATALVEEWQRRHLDAGG